MYVCFIDDESVEYHTEEIGFYETSLPRGVLDAFDRVISPIAGDHFRLVFSASLVPVGERLDFQCIFDVSTD